MRRKREGRRRRRLIVKRFDIERFVISRRGVSSVKDARLRRYDPDAFAAARKERSERDRENIGAAALCRRTGVERIIKGPRRIAPDPHSRGGIPFVLPDIEPV